MRYFTASEAKTKADGSKRVERLVKGILREVKRAAKKGKYHVSIKYSEFDEKLATKACVRLGELGYTALTDFWRAAIYVNWD